MQWIRSLALLLVLSGICAPPAMAQKHQAQPVSIKGVRLWRAPDNTRLVFDLSGPAEHKLFDMPGENGRAQRLVITIENARFSADTSGLGFTNSPIAALQHADDGAQERVVIELNARVKPKSFLLAANKQYGDRLVVDLFDADTVAEVKTVPPPSSGLRDVIIAVDPGHGGEDPGAGGPGGVHEKNVTLAIAKQLVNEINDMPGYSAFLTRTGDYFVSLRGRTQIARKKNADFFVSIHADAFKDNSASGASVFALSQRGATSETARWLAQSENDADLVGGVNLGDKDPMLQEVLLDLSMTATVSNSLDMGAEVLGQLKKITPLHRGFVEQAGFVVLKSPDIPSLLVETGFITNAGEAKRLTSPEYQKKLAKAVFVGVDKYVRRKPPMDTALAMNQRGVNKHLSDARPVGAPVHKEDVPAHQDKVTEQQPAEPKETKPVSVAANDAAVAPTPDAAPKAEPKPQASAAADFEQALADEDAASQLPAVKRESGKEAGTADKSSTTKVATSKAAAEKSTIDKVKTEKISSEKPVVEKTAKTEKPREKMASTGKDSQPTQKKSRSSEKEKTAADKTESQSDSSSKSGKKTVVKSSTTSHVVAKGESLSGIALQYHVKVTALRDANQLADDDDIRAGQKLRIPAAN